MFEKALVEELKTISALNNRIYPLTAPEDIKSPYVIYVSSEGQHTNTFDGYIDSKSINGEINVIAPRYADMKAITKQVVALLISMSKRQIGTDGPFIQELTYDEPVEFFEPQPKLYRCLIDFEVYI